MVDHKKLRRIYTEEKLQGWQEAGLGHQKADVAVWWSEPTLEPGFRV